VTRRQLVKLTIENIEEYQEKIINQDKAMNDWKNTKSSE